MAESEPSQNARHVLHRAEALQLEPPDLVWLGSQLKLLASRREAEAKARALKRAQPEE